MTKEIVRGLLQLLLCGVLGPGLAVAQKADNPDEATVGKPALRPEIPKDLIGKPERISGTISMVLPEQRLIVLTVPAASVPKFLMVLEENTTVTQRPEGGVVKHHRKVILNQSDEANFNFKVTKSTSIVMGGQPMSGSLAALNNKQATVRFVPLRSGNIAQSIEVDR